jgi:hypothetical protein
VTSGISRSAGAQSFGGAHRGRVCVRVFIGVGVNFNQRAYWNSRWRHRGECEFQPARLLEQSVALVQLGAPTRPLEHKQHTYPHVWL